MNECIFDHLQVITALRTQDTTPSPRVLKRSSRPEVRTGSDLLSGDSDLTVVLPTSQSVPHHIISSLDRSSYDMTSSVDQPNIPATSQHLSGFSPPAIESHLHLHETVTPSLDSVTNPPPRPRTPPHRQVPPRKPVKGILKPPRPPQAKFNFKRDILNPFSTRLGYATVEESPLNAVVGTGTGAVGQGVQAAAGWVGSAFKRLGAVAAAEKAKLDDALQSQTLLPQPRQSSTSKPSDTNVHNEHKSIPPVDPSQDRQSSISVESIDNLQPSITCLTPATLPLATTSVESSSVTNSSQTFAVSVVPPVPNPQAVLSVSTLKKVHFTMSDLKIIYPISNSQPPSFDQLNKLRINEARRLLISNRLSQPDRLPDQPASGPSSHLPSIDLKNGWNASSLESLYDECCRTREEGWGIVKLREIIKQAAPSPPKSIDLTGIQLNGCGSVELLGDLISVDFGLNSLTLESCGLEDDTLKPILHALLVSGSLPSLNLANNKKIRAKGWRMVAVFLTKARALRNLDLSDNSFDKRSVEYLAQALAGQIRKDDYYTPQTGTNKPSGMTSTLTTYDPTTSRANHPATQMNPESENSQRCTTDQDSHRTASLTQTVPSLADEEQPLFRKAPLLRDDSPSPAFQALSAISVVPKAGPSKLVSLRLDRCNLKVPHLDLLSHSVRLSKLKHISLRQNKIGHLGAVALAVMIRDWPAQPNGSSSGTPLSNSENALESLLRQGIHSTEYEAVTPRLAPPFESSNSVTARQTNLLDDHRISLKPAFQQPDSHSSGALSDSSGAAKLGLHQPSSGISSMIQQEVKKANEQRIKLKSKIDSLPKMGHLLTLDVKSNELKSADVFYLAQVLKKNRTLKVLNLADNKIDSIGLVHLSDALRFNTCLETLDLSKNPCCAGGLEGMLALRTTCTVNTTLKRLFLSETELSSEGAIALAEFLPEMQSLIHLDLTENYSIDIAGVMALAVSVKMNTNLRCLDINIPPNDPDFARLSQEILQSCVRNTELAQRQALERGQMTSISQPMLKSTVVRELTTPSCSEVRARTKKIRAAAFP
ncbi:uncharacterized protein MELLADRAFT_88133 [Melampsora larici-populina 98AG31]|uniref:RNI-like protein n=1 Tax=Melampsora larici-populina (strain 98AG31 / pathotype 3-4-7) TaxID=747676 RepID=F4RQP5_MELLP|nr:uncharacterized protein MELLADRAFT_88133 [Melampsora larici-populina 98AG31]EGG05072.1 hypothetical protein MELLADRAFT_88133 [Melampsora larici-populina 98AG31]